MGPLEALWPQEGIRKTQKGPSEVVLGPLAEGYPGSFRGSPVPSDGPS